MTDFEGLIHRLRAAEVRFVVIGGFAGTVLGSPRITIDLDIVYARDAGNLARLAGALKPLGRPKDLEVLAELEALLEEGRGER